MAEPIFKVTHRRLATIPAPTTTGTGVVPPEPPTLNEDIEQPPGLRGPSTPGPSSTNGGGDTSVAMGTPVNRMQNNLAQTPQRLQDQQAKGVHPTQTQQNLLAEQQRAFNQQRANQIAQEKALGGGSTGANPAWQQAQQNIQQRMQTRRSALHRSAEFDEERNQWLHDLDDPDYFDDDPAPSYHHDTRQPMYTLKADGEVYPEPTSDAMRHSNEPACETCLMNRVTLRPSDDDRHTDRELYGYHPYKPMAETGAGERLARRAEDWPDSYDLAQHEMDLPPDPLADRVLNPDGQARGPMSDHYDVYVPPIRHVDPRSPQYDADYKKGWDASDAFGMGTWDDPDNTPLDRMDDSNASHAAYDGYMDRAVGRAYNHWRAVRRLNLNEPEDLPDEHWDHPEKVASVKGGVREPNGVGSTKTAAVEVQHQGDSPLDYQMGTKPGDAWHPQRLGLVDHEAGEPAAGEPYFAAGRQPAAAPGTLAFLDYSHPSPDHLHVHYMKTRSDQEGQGHQRRLAESLLAGHPEARVVNFGDEMEPAVTHLRKSLQEAHPDMLIKGKIRYRTAAKADMTGPDANGEIVYRVDAKPEFVPTPKDGTPLTGHNEVGTDPEIGEPLFPDYEGDDGDEVEGRVRDEYTAAVNPGLRRFAAPVGEPDSQLNVDRFAPGVQVKNYAGETGNRDHITRTEVGMMPTWWFRDVPGAAGEVRGEHRNRQGADWEAFKNHIQQNGIQRPIFVTVDHDGDPVMSEGNHRWDAAHELGMTHVPAEVRYYGNAQNQGTLAQRAMMRRTAAGPDLTEPHPKCGASCTYGGTHCAVCHEPVKINLHSDHNGGWHHADGMKRDHPAVPADPQGVIDSIPGQLARKDQARMQVRDHLDQQFQSIDPDYRPRSRGDEGQMPLDPFTASLNRNTNEFEYDLDHPNYFLFDRPPSSRSYTRAPMFNIKDDLPVDDDTGEHGASYTHPAYPACEGCISRGFRTLAPDDVFHDRGSERFNHTYSPVEDLPSGERLAAVSPSGEFLYNIDDRDYPYGDPPPSKNRAFDRPLYQVKNDNAEGAQEPMRHPGHAPCQSCVDRGLKGIIGPEHPIHRSDSSYPSQHQYRPAAELAPGVRLAAANPETGEWEYEIDHPTYPYGLEDPPSRDSWSSQPMVKVKAVTPYASDGGITPDPVEDEHGYADPSFVRWDGAHRHREHGQCETCWNEGHSPGILPDSALHNPEEENYHHPFKAMPDLPAGERLAMTNPGLGRFV